MGKKGFKMSVKFQEQSANITISQDFHFKENSSKNSRIFKEFKDMCEPCM